MKRTISDILNKARGKASNSRGMTMAEMIIAVAIIIILAAVAFISVMQYQRMLAQLERDKVAKDIFFAAQNHLIAARGEGYLELGMDANTNAEKQKVYGIQEAGDVYYFVHTPGGNDINDPDSILNLMLPFGSIDETVRGGGSYVVRYNRSTGQVLDVFYCTEEGTRFGYNLLGSVTYSSIISESTENGYYGDGNKVRRRNNFNGNKSVLGWYGGDSAEYGTPEPLKAPSIEVINGDTLKVKVTDNMTTSPSIGYSIKLIITGKSSGAKKAYVLKNSGSEALDSSGRVISTTSPYEVVLDDITKEGLHFGSIDADTTEKFIPGEDIAIQAVAYSLGGLATVEYSEERVTNSLFASSGDNLTGNVEGTDGKPDTAYISNLRHLENLDNRISNLDARDTSNDVRISEAIQTTDLSWSGTFWNDSTVVTYSNFADTADEGDGSYQPNNSTDPGYYKPAKLLDGFNYDGKMYSITGIKANENKTTAVQDGVPVVTAGGNAGLFSSTSAGSVRNLELIDFDITSNGGKAGALAGATTGTDISNVIVRNTNNDKTTLSKNVSNGEGGGIAGGLIGEVNGGSVMYCAADVLVGGNTTTVAGGLIGSVAGGTVEGCYAAGHTKDGSYQKWLDEKEGNTLIHNYDVIGATAGGLVGSSSGTINHSYSTCSVSGTTAGGFVGSASGSITNSYSTGQVKTTDKTKEDEVVNTSIGAFAGSIDSTTTVTDCNYLSIINEVMLKKGDEDAELDHYLGAVGDDNKPNIKAIDENTSESDAYDKFVSGKSNWKPADPYDDTLATYYDGKYNLKTVAQLSGDAPAITSPYASWSDLFINSHFGDWPAPEVFIVNE